MNKLLHAIIAGLAAASFSAIAADDKASADKPAKAKVEKKGSAATGGSKAETKTDAKVDSKAHERTEAAPAPAPAPTKIETEKK